MKIRATLGVFLTGIMLVMLSGNAAEAAPGMSLSVAPAGPGGIATATVALTDAADVESFSLTLDFTGGTVLALPTSTWFTRGGYIPVTPFGSAPSVELNNVFESTAMNKVFLDVFKPSGTSGAIGTISLQVSPSATIGATHNLALTGQYLSASTQKVTDFAPSTMTFTVSSVPTYLLTTILAGTGTGSVHSVPGGISCDAGTCGASFDANSQVALYKTPGSSSVFSGWSGDGCSGIGDCTVTMTGNKTITATFTYVPAVRLMTTIPTYYDFIQAAMGAASGSITIEARDTTVTENLNITKGYQYLLKGGFDAEFKAQTGYTTLQGNVTVGTGSLVVDRLLIK